MSESKKPELKWSPIGNGAKWHAHYNFWYAACGAGPVDRTGARTTQPDNACKNCVREIAKRKNS